jgi:hypothetical protein
MAAGMQVTPCGTTCPTTLRIVEGTAESAPSRRSCASSFVASDSCKAGCNGTAPNLVLCVPISSTTAKSSSLGASAMYGTVDNQRRYESNVLDSQASWCQVWLRQWVANRPSKNRFASLLFEAQAASTRPEPLSDLKHRFQRAYPIWSGAPQSSTSTLLSPVLVWLSPNDQ